MHTDTPRLCSECKHFRGCKEKNKKQPTCFNWKKKK